MEYSGRMSAYEHKHNYLPGNPVDEDTKAGLRKAWFLDAQWSTCPVEVENDVKKLWRIYELGNDRYMLKMSINDLQELLPYKDEETGEEYEGHESEEWIDGNWKTVPLSLDYLFDYIRSHGISDDEEVIIHWWW